MGSNTSGPGSLSLVLQITLLVEFDLSLGVIYWPGLRTMWGLHIPGNLVKALTYHPPYRFTPSKAGMWIVQHIYRGSSAGSSARSMHSWFSWYCHGTKVPMAKSVWFERCWHARLWLLRDAISKGLRVWSFYPSLNFQGLDQLVLEP